MLISEIYNQKPLTLRAGSHIKNVIHDLVAVESNAAIIVDEQDVVVGVISIQDIARVIVPDSFEDNVEMAMAMYSQGFFHRQCHEVMEKGVEEIMHKDFLKVNLETNIMAVMAELLKYDLYIVPVIENGKLIGVVTRTEIKKAIAIGMSLEN